MGKLIQIGNFSRLAELNKDPEQEESKTLRDLLINFKSQSLKDPLRLFANQLILIVSPEDFQRILEVRINKFLMNYTIGSDLLLCGNYAASLLAYLDKFRPFSWYVVDHYFAFQKEKNPQIAKSGGDLCFVICVLFIGHKRHRGFGKTFFQTAGKFFYLSFYRLTGRPIGYYMKNHFPLIVEASSSALKNIKIN